MQKIILIGFAVVAVLGVVLVFSLLLSENEETTPEPPAGVEFPRAGTPPPTGTGGTDGATVPVRTHAGETTAVRDFRNDENVEQTADGNYYIMRDTASPDTASYEILYSSTDGGIIVSLREEPLSQTRRAAENALVQHLGVSRDALCDLAISVGVAADVNQLYAGEELGVSGCVGSQPL